MFRKYIPSPRGVPEGCVIIITYLRHVEMVVSLSHKKADTHININVEFGDDKGQIPIDTIARKAKEGG
ncbi:MAG: hypothetical protein GX941_08220 [Candidatus Methanofastidiosa archaeon]|nr:hypothetical protein [Candidatus Methanofastidiosa archaeon]